MRPVLAAQLKSRPGRLIATAIAVIVAVAFVVVTLSLGGAFTSTMRQAFGEVLKHADAEIECVDVGAGDAEEDPCAGVLERVRSVDGVAAAAAVASSALELRGEGERLHVQSFALIDPALRWQDLRAGTWPEGDDEIALDADSAKQLAAGVGDRVEVHMDGGIRSGQDVIKAMAVGAAGVFIGRAYAYGLGAMGQRGVEAALDIIKREMDLTMGLCGINDVSEIGPQILWSEDLA